MPYISPEHRDKQKTVKEGTEDVKKVWNSSSAEQLRTGELYELQANYMG